MITLGMMKVSVYGTGGIESVIGGHLGRIGRDVVLIGRSSHVNAINENGLRLVMPNGNDILRLSAVTSPEQVDVMPDDVVFLCIKGQDTEEALRTLRLARKLGWRAPINEGLLRISQEMAVNRETSGRYTPNQVRKLFGLEDSLQSSGIS
ncbi:ketopantoate reductase family protein [Chloroflexota bacterium]